MRIPESLLILLCLSVPAGAEIVDRIAATVNDTAIPESAVRRALVVGAYEPEAGESPEAFRARVLDAMIDQQLEYEDAVRFRPAPPDASEVNAELQKLRERLRAEGKDPEAEFAGAGLTVDEVRAALERQLIVARYLRERFTPIAFADEERAREEYEKRFAPELEKAGQPVPPFEGVSDQMRLRSQQRVFDEEVAKWLKDLRQKARISVYRIPIQVPEGRPRVLISQEPTPAPTRPPS